MELEPSVTDDQPKDSQGFEQADIGSRLTGAEQALMNVRDTNAGELMTGFALVHDHPGFQKLPYGTPIEVTMTVSLRTRKFKWQDREYRLTRPFRITVQREAVVH